MWSSSRKAALTGLVLVTVLVYARGMHGQFELDDLHTVEWNSTIHHLGNYVDFSQWLGILQAARVLTDFTFALDYAIAGLDPFPYHVTNLAIHLAAVLLVYAFTRRVLAFGGLAKRESLSLVVAAVFALHPLQTQAVIYVSQRAESLASALYLGSLLLLLEAERRGRRAAGAALYAAAFVAFVLGLGTKTIVLTLPFAYLLMGILPGRAAYANELARPRKRLALAAPFVLYSVLVVLLVLPKLKGNGTGLDVAGFGVPWLPPWRYFRTEWHVIVTYLRLLFWPAGQNLDWDFPLARGFGDPIVLACGLFLATLLIGTGIILYRNYARADDRGAVARVMAFGVFWFYLVLSHTSTLLPILDVLVEHRLYLASFGVFLAVIVGADHALARVRKQASVTLVLLLCASLAGLAFVRVGTWRSKLLMWTDVVAKSPRKARAHLGLGNAYCLAGQRQLAIDEYTAALELAADDPIWIRSDIREKLAATFLSQGRTADAITAAQAGLTEKPDHSGLLGTLALAHLQRHELPEAEVAAEKAVRAAPKSATALLALGMVRAQRGDQPGALDDFERAVKLEPDLLQGCLLLAGTYRAQGRNQEACDVLLRADKPTNPELQAQLREALTGCTLP